jgi:hypothetical protein
MTTIRQLIKDAYGTAGITTMDEEPNASETTEGLRRLNRMLSMWATSSLLVYTRGIESFPLQANVNEYTIGIGQTFNTSRPMQIVSAYIRQGNVDFDVDVISDVNYDGFAVKETGGIPFALMYDNNSPTAKVFLYPTPTAGQTLFIRTEKPLAEFGLDDVIQLPAGYEYAIDYNLAMHLASRSGLQPDPILVNEAAQSLRQIKKSVAVNRSTDRRSYGRVGRFDIRSGGWMT